MNSEAEVLLPLEVMHYGETVNAGATRARITDTAYQFSSGEGHKRAEVRAEQGSIICLGAGIGVDDIEFLVCNYSAYYTKYADLVIRVKSTGETLTIVKGYANVANRDNPYSIQGIEFSDGTIWSYSDMLQHPITMMDGEKTGFTDPTGSTLIGNSQNNTLNGDKGSDVLSGGAGDDNLYGNAGNDILHGGAGNDILEGGAGDDIYVFNLGDGHDVIRESESRADRCNLVRLGAGIGVNDVEFLISNYYAYYSMYADLVIRIKSTGETLTIVKGYANVANRDNPYSIQGIEFSDGTVWHYSDMLQRPITMVDGEKTGFTDPAGSTLIGNSQNNTLNGGKGDDVLSGGAGDDIIYGNAGNDILHGGGGNDSLHGGVGDDIYLFNQGDGTSKVIECEYNPNKRNIIRFGEGISPGSVRYTLTNYANGYMDMVIYTGSNNDTITIVKGMSSKANKDNPYSIQAFEFANGTVMEYEEFIRRGLISMEDDDIYGMTDYAGSSIFGNALDNTIYGSDGDDTIIAGLGGKNTVYGGKGNDVLYGSYDNDVIYGGEGNDLLSGEAGNDTLYAGVGNDFLVGDLGDDYMEGGAGDDTYTFIGNDGHDVVFDSSGNDTFSFRAANIDELWFSRDGGDLLISRLGTNDDVRVKYWFTSTSYQVETIASETKYSKMELLHTQMAQMVQAMATFAADPAEYEHWTTEQRDSFTTLVSGYWQPRA